jgi:hypothetical protein
MAEFADALPHGQLQEVFPNVFFVTGSMRGEFFGSMWQFSRNMVVLREDGSLTVVNSVRLNEDGLRQLDELGKVVNVVRIGDMHGIDDPFYVARYGATFWAMPGMDIQEELKVDKWLTAGGEMPVRDSSFFEFKTTKLPEGILRIDREGGIMIACDSLQNWVGPDEFFDPATVETMRGMNFFTRAGIGLAWIHESAPKAEDFVRLKEVPFAHALCGHGEPLLDTAQAEYHEAFQRFFGV